MGIKATCKVDGPGGPPAGHCRVMSEDDQLCRWVESSQVTWVRSHDVLPAPTGADHDVSIDYVRRPARGEQSADTRGIDPIERNDVGRRLADQPRQAYLTLRPPDCLG